MRGFDQLIEHYEEIARVTREMREAAGAENWDDLVTMQEEYSRLVDQLESSDAQAPLDAQQRARKFDLIRRILDDDARIRARLEPRLARLSALLASGRQARALQGAYGRMAE
jgi:flagellar protein FliT